MKRLFLVASLALVAVVVAPIASASATTVKGVCTIEGTATIFEKGSFTIEEALEVKGTKEQNYKFNANAGTHCAGVNEKNEPATATVVKAEVKGEGDLGCEESKSKSGSGEIELSVTGKDTITTFKFTGKATEVKFEAEGANVKALTGGGPAVGEASFGEDLGAVAKCNPLLSKVGPKKLKFVAITVGTIS